MILCNLLLIYIFKVYYYYFLIKDLNQRLFSVSMFVFRLY